jgi:hypothetical protein
MALSATLRKRLDIQGYDCVDDGTLERTQLWLRVSPALCGAIAAAGVALASPAILWGLSVIAAAGAILPFHPFDVIYNAGIRRITRSPRLPLNGPPRRFACGMASIGLAATGALFALDYTLAGYVFGIALIAVAALLTFTHICVPSTIYRATLGRWRDPAAEAHA